MAQTILIVDDSKSVRTALRWVLRKSGDTVVTATGFQEAKDHETPDVVFVDYQLPDGSAADLAKHFHDAGAATIVVHGDYHDVSIATFERLGVRYFLPKPFRSQEVLDVLDAAVRGDEPVSAAPAEKPTLDDEHQAEPEISRVPPPPTGPPTDAEEDQPQRTPRGTMALKGMPRPTEPEAEPAVAPPPADDAVSAESTEQRPMAPPTPPPTAPPIAEPSAPAKRAVTDSAEVVVASERIDAEAARTSDSRDEAKRSETRGIERAAVKAAGASPESTTRDETSRPATASGTEFEADATAVSRAQIEEFIRAQVAEEVARAVDSLIEEGLDTKLPELVKNAIREMLRDELNEKVVGYAKRKIDTFASNDLPRIAERVVERKV